MALSVSLHYDLTLLICPTMVVLTWDIICLSKRWSNPFEIWVMGDWFAEVMRVYSKAYSEKWGDFTTDGVERITGHPSHFSKRLSVRPLHPR